MTQRRPLGSFVQPSSGDVSMHLSHAVVYVDDGGVPDVVDFYERAFGLTRRFYDPGYQYAELASGAATIAIAGHAAGALMMPGAYEVPPRGTRVANTELAFATDDVQGAYDRAVAAGATIITAPYAVPWGQTVAYVRSPEGTIVGFCTPLPSAVQAATKPLPDGVILLAPGQGRQYPCGPMQSAFLADGEETGDRYSVSIWWVDPGKPGPGAHSHDANEELFYVIEGTMTFLVGDQHIDAPTGTFLRIPARVTHDFENRTTSRAGALNVFIPGGFETNMPSIVDWFRTHPEQ